MKDTDIYDILMKHGAFEFDKQKLVAQLKKGIEVLQKQGFDDEEIIAFMEGSQHKTPQNIPIFKLWTKRILQELREKQRDDKDKNKD